MTHKAVFFNIIRIAKWNTSCETPAKPYSEENCKNDKCIDKTKKDAETGEKQP